MRIEIARQAVQQRSSYIRTITDIDRFLTGDRTQKNILEVGFFLGAVSIFLKKLGFNMFAIDIPEFHQSKRLRALYNKHDVSFTGLNLRVAKLPFESNSMNTIVMCEVLEHLNFNPWREYTISETVEMLESIGFSVIEKYFFQPEYPRYANKFFIKTLRKIAVFLPSFRSLHVVVGKKKISAKI